MQSILGISSPSKKDIDQLEVRANKGSKGKGSAFLGTHSDLSLFHI